MVGREEMRYVGIVEPTKELRCVCSIHTPSARSGKVTDALVVWNYDLSNPFPVGFWLKAYLGRLLEW